MHVGAYSWEEICARLSRDPRWREAERYLSPSERESGISNGRLFAILDQAWDELGGPADPDEEFLRRYYAHPVWLLNAAFVESDRSTVEDRKAAVRLLAHVHPQKVLDFGGGFGTSSRLCAVFAETVNTVHLLDISPFCETIARHLADYPKVVRVEAPEPQYDAIVCTEVLEHLRDPVGAVIALSPLLRRGGAFTASWSFAAGPKCHLPANFHLRRSMVTILRLLGFGYYGFERRGSTVWGFVKTREATPERVRAARFLERLSRIAHPPLAVLRSAAASAR